MHIDLNWSAKLRLFNEEERVEHDRFRERDRENRLHENRRGGAGIATDGRGCAHADQTDTYGRAKSREAYVNASIDLCQYW